MFYSILTLSNARNFSIISVFGFGMKQCRNIFTAILWKLQKIIKRIFWHHTIMALICDTAKECFHLMD